MNKAIDLNIRGLKCDNPKCDYLDMNAEYDYEAEWVDARCPKCNEQLMTKEDYESARQMIQLSEILNKIMPKPEENEPKIKATMKSDGKGNVSLDNIEVLED